jgi:hypothetical protein
VAAEKEMTRPMPRLVLAIIAITMAAAGSAAAYDFPPVKPLDTVAVDPAMLADVYGAWEIRSRNGAKRCRIVLQREPAIGGSAIEVAPDCVKHFPVMADIAGWRLLEGWTIDLIDPLRKTRVRFETPDERYVAFGDPRDIAGMDELVKRSDGQKPRKR